MLVLVQVPGWERRRLQNVAIQALVLQVIYTHLEPREVISVFLGFSEASNYLQGFFLNLFLTFQSFIHKQ